VTIIERRDFLAGVGGLAAGAAWPSGPGAAGGGPAADQPGATSFPRKGDFDIPEGLVYLNGAYTHPMPIVAREAAQRMAGIRSRPGGISEPSPNKPDEVKAQIAALINARPSEIGFIPNTSTGENLVVNGLDLVGSGANVVTDALHFDGALLHLQALQQQHGLDVRIAPIRDGRIALEDLDRRIDKRTRLVELSLVSMYNGFQHDLKAVCDLAHARGALVYADIIQAAGATPIDVRASGVDFCACSSFKWLMGDFGLGFLYAREDLLGRVIRRSQYGYHSASRLQSHVMPGDRESSSPVTWELGAEASTFFEVGSLAYGAMAALGASLPYLRRLGVERIEAHRQPLLERLRQEMPRLGFAPFTPPGTKSALLTFTVTDRPRVLDRLTRANINVRLGPNFMRISPSVYNDMRDIERLLESLA
jgi:selenocysteine lyase/cysteine desulfurase